MEITAENIPKLLKKKIFTRQNVAEIIEITPTAGSYNDTEEVAPRRQRLLKITQDQFLKELDPNSHDINNPAIYPNKVKKDDKGNSTVTYVARVSIALQRFIANRQAIHQLANPVILSKGRKDEEEVFLDFKEFWRFSGIDNKMLEVLKSAKSTGDGAVYFFFDDDKELNFKCWSYKDGDVLIPRYKSDGATLKSFTHRYFSVDEEGKEVDTVEVYDDTNRYLFVQNEKNEWENIDVKPHGFGVVPVAYHREDDVAWACVQDLIDKLERSLSDYRDSNAYFTYGMLFLKGQTIDVLPDKDTQGKVIISEDSESDAKLLEQNNVAKGFEFEFTNYLKTIYYHTGTVVIDPEDFKGGDVTGAAVRNYYDPAIQQALMTEPDLQGFIKQVISIMKVSFGIAEGKTLAMKNFKIKADLDIYVPRNISEEVTLINQSVTMGSLSARTASERNKFSKSDEYERILLEFKNKKDETESSIGNDGDKKVTPTKKDE